MILLYQKRTASRNPFSSVFLPYILFDVPITGTLYPCLLGACGANLRNKSDGKLVKCIKFLQNKWECSLIDRRK